MAPRELQALPPSVAAQLLKDDMPSRIDEGACILQRQQAQGRCLPLGATDGEQVGRGNRFADQGSHLLTNCGANS